MQNFAQLFAHRKRFFPKTQAQALAAFQEGVVDEAVFVWKAVNIHPVFEEPWDLDEVERLLAKDDLDFETSLLLMTIFERLIRDPDKERALFAAESINAVERRRMKRIQALRDEFARAPLDAHAQARALARELRELGLLCFARPVLKRFYLEEALAVARGTVTTDASPPESSDGAGADPVRAALEVELLLDLDLPDDADVAASRAVAAFPGAPELRLLAAKTSYARRDFRGTARCLRAAAGDPQADEFRAFWTSGGADA